MYRASRSAGKNLWDFCPAYLTAEARCRIPEARSGTRQAHAFRHAQRKPARGKGERLLSLRNCAPEPERRRWRTTSGRKQAPSEKTLDIAALAVRADRTEASQRNTHMSSRPSASRTSLTTSASPATEHASQLTYTFDDRHWRVRGLEKQLSCERLKVNLLVSRRELVHIDTLDLYAARLRRTFLEEAAAELYVAEATLKQDLGSVLLDLELRQEALIRQRVARQVEPEPVLTEAERTEALNCCRIRG